MKAFKHLVLFVIVSLVLVGVTLFMLAQKPAPETVTYGMSFNTGYALELDLDWQEAYDAILNDLNVRHLRLAAHWPMVEPEQGEYNFDELDYQIAKAEDAGATVILGVGRRLPRWPECHIPKWVKPMSEAEVNEALLEYIEQVVVRYKNSPAVMWWQVENEPFLEVFAFEHCGKLDKDLLDKEIALVKSLDDRPVLVTDSGNLGTWYGAYSRGDVFGTSVYVHLWNPDIGQLRTVLPGWFYRVKDNVMAILFGEKPSVLIELSIEPWLLEHIAEVPLEVQFSRMDLRKFEEILIYAHETHYDTQYLWGAEWWYWLHLQGHSEMWERGQRLYADDEDQ